MPKVSVIVPVYDGEKYILETLSSIRAQFFRDFEVIVVDDGSTDATVSLVEGVDKNINIIRCDRKGVSKARNIGVAAAQGQFIAFLDADDLWNPGKLLSQIGAFERDSEELGVVFTEFVAGNIVPDYFNNANVGDSGVCHELSGWIYPKLLLTNWALTSSLMIRRSAFLDAGGFDESLEVGEDWDLLLRLSRHVRFCKLAGEMVFYRQHAMQTTRRPRKTDFQEFVVERAVSRWGLCGPDGESVDVARFQQRRYRRLISHGFAHLASGDPSVAQACFLKAVKQKPFSLKLWFNLLRAWRVQHGLPRS